MKTFLARTLRRLAQRIAPGAETAGATRAAPGPAAVGAEIVRALRDYERRGGEWR